MPLIAAIFFLDPRVTNIFYFGGAIVICLSGILRIRFLAPSMYGAVRTIFTYSGFFAVVGGPLMILFFVTRAILSSAEASLSATLLNAYVFVEGLEFVGYGLSWLALGWTTRLRESAVAG